MKSSNTPSAPASNGSGITENQTSTPRPAPTIDDLKAKVARSITPQQKLPALGQLRAAFVRAGDTVMAGAITAQMELEKKKLHGGGQPQTRHPQQVRVVGKSQLAVSESEVERLNDELVKAPVEKRAHILGMLGKVLKALGHRERANRAYAAMAKERTAPGSTIPKPPHPREEQPRGISPRRHEEFLRNFDKPSRRPAGHQGLQRAEIERRKEAAGKTTHPSGLNRAQRRAKARKELAEKLAAAEAAAKAAEAPTAPEPEPAPKKERAKKTAAAPKKPRAKKAATVKTEPAPAAEVPTETPAPAPAEPVAVLV